MKTKRKLIWHIYPWVLLITLLPLLAIILYTSNTGRELFMNGTRADLLNQARILQNSVTRLLEQDRPDEIDRLCKETGAVSSTRFTVILPDGRVIGDSQKNPGSMDFHGNRPEILNALKTGTGSSERYSATLNHQMMYVALRLSNQEGRHLGVLRTAIPVTAIDRALHTIEIRTAVGGLVVALLAAMISLYVTRRISRPIEEMKYGAELFAGGDLTHRLPTPPSAELAGLADTMNAMALQLEDRIQTVISQRNEYEAVLSSMVEGVIAVDQDETILSINQAALDMLKIRSSDAKSRTIHEVVRNRQFLEFVMDSLAGKTLGEKDVEIQGPEKHIINIRSMALRNAANEHIGSLVVLNDVTKIRHLESIRKDFVANVSHEIKTPLTAIKGFVETLQQGMDKGQGDNLKFLGIIDKHVNRLNAIVEDLLALARIEQIDEKATMALEKRRLKSLLENAVNVVQHRVDVKNISLEVQIEENPHIRVDSTLFEQALVNLLDNAVAYSPENGRVTIAAEQGKKEFVITITDQGIGIAQQHLPRLFERFYRVDKARSRKHGGTGLGLAIVKHIAQAHGGKVTVESQPGQGSIFRIHLPADLIEPE
jgi:two-component system phosphate regulon sensor histidine kinase PhoR